MKFMPGIGEAIQPYNDTRIQSSATMYSKIMPCRIYSVIEKVGKRQNLRPNNQPDLFTSQ